jgi:hypothetical protein
MVVCGMYKSRSKKVDEARAGHLQACVDQAWDH